MIWSDRPETVAERSRVPGRDHAPDGRCRPLPQAKLRIHREHQPASAKDRLCADQWRAGVERRRDAVVVDDDAVQMRRQKTQRMGRGGCRPNRASCRRRQPELARPCAAAPASAAAASLKLRGTTVSLTGVPRAQRDRRRRSPPSTGPREGAGDVIAGIAGVQTNRCAIRAARARGRTTLPMPAVSAMWPPTVPIGSGSANQRAGAARASAAAGPPARR